MARRSRTVSAERMWMSLDMVVASRMAAEETGRQRGFPSGSEDRVMMK